MGPHLGYGDIIRDRAWNLCGAARLWLWQALRGRMCKGPLWWAAVDCGVSGAGSGFPVGWRTAGGV